jgi:hypothetical protein
MTKNHRRIVQGFRIPGFPRQKVDKLISRLGELALLGKGRPQKQGSFAAVGNLGEVLFQKMNRRLVIPHAG